MGGFKTWLSGFAWGAMLAFLATCAAGVVLFRPDIIDRLKGDITTERVQKALTPASIEDGRVLASNTSTKQALDIPFAPPRAFAVGDDLVIRGSNSSGGPVELNIRIDDTASQNWMSRFGHVAVVQPGPYQVRIPLDSLPTPGQSKLNINAITRIVIFTPEGAPTANIEAVRIEKRQTTGSLAPAPTDISVGQAWLKGARFPAVQEFPSPVAFDANQELVITGVNTSDKPVTVHLRVDDVNSKNWYSRANASGTYPPGPFVLRSPVSSWVTPSKARLDRTKISRIVVSLGDGEGPATLGGVAVEGASPVPSDALALRFVPSADFAVPGFETVLPDDKRLDRPAGSLTRTPNDPLLSSGLNGIHTVTVPWTKSATATISLWTEDQGEWEYFPHSLNRTIVINGQVVLQESYTPGQWIDQVFKRGLWKEAMIDGGPWEVFARERAGLITATVPVIDGKIVVQLSSDQPPNNGYLAAMVVEPGDNTAAVDAIEDWRRKRFLERWPVVDKPVDPSLAKGVTLRAVGEGHRIQHPFWDPTLPFDTTIRAARGALVSVDFLAFSDQDDLMPNVTVTAPDGISPQVRWGKWTYMRGRGEGERALSITSDVLEGNLDHMRIVAGVPRRINLTFTVPETASGTLPIVLQMNIAGNNVQAQANVTVIPQVLPAIDKPIGYYVAAPNDEVWFPPTPADVDRLMACDFATLRSFGITGISPEITAPFADKRARYVDQMRLVAKAGFKPPYFDYTSVKHLLDREDKMAAAQDVAAIQKELAIAGLPLPLWSIADEPMPGSEEAGKLRAIRDAIRLAAPDANIAGHLNDAKVQDLVPLFDTLLVNNGFGVSSAIFDFMRSKNVKPWLYNMPDHRAAAGFLFWRLGVEGYLQWHARAVTADPRDPTDGREPDFTILPLAADRCQLVPTVDALILTMVDGMQDLRWLTWLDARAKADPKARELQQALLTAVPNDWAAFARQKPDLAALRARILDYAAALPAN